jgi:hypothetical protein
MLILLHSMLNIRAVQLFTTPSGFSKILSHRTVSSEVEIGGKVNEEKNDFYRIFLNT